MSKDKALVTDINHFVEAMSPADREACEELAEFLRMQVRKAGMLVGTVALTLVAVEVQDQEEKFFKK